MNNAEITCPECGSKNIMKQAEYAAVKLEGESVQHSHIVPNECREESCRHRWHDEE